MNKQDDLNEELRFRRWVQTILIEEAVYEASSKNPEVLLEYMLITEEDNLIGVFVDPFKDLFNVAKVATKDLLSIAKFQFDMLITLSPAKMDAARAKYDARTKKIEDEWAKAMEPIDATWESGDAQLVAFMLNPAGFLGGKLVGKGVDTALGTTKLLDDAGWGIPVVGGLVGLTGSGGEDKDSKDKDKGGDGKVDIIGTGTKLLGDMAKLFFIAHHEPAGPLIAEEKKEEKKPTGDIEEGVQQYIDGLDGFQKAIDEDAKELVAAKKEQIDEIVALFEAQMKLLIGLSEAQDLKTFASVIQTAQQAGIDLGGSGLENFQGVLDKGVDAILNKPESRAEFVKTSLQQKGEKIPTGEDGEEQLPEVSDDELRPEIEKVVFLDSKRGVQEQLFTGTQQLKEETINLIKENVPEEKDFAVMQKTGPGKEYVSMIQTALQKVESM